MEKINIGVAGLGFIGPAHIEALRRIPNLHVAAVSDFNVEIAQSKAEELGIDYAYGDYDELLAHEGIHCVHICTPNFLHYEMAKKAFRHTAEYDTAISEYLTGTDNSDFSCYAVTGEALQ